nr:MAG: coat protein [Wufeng shrew nodamuvirus 1]
MAKGKKKRKGLTTKTTTIAMPTNPRAAVVAVTGKAKRKSKPRGSRSGGLATETSFPGVAARSISGTGRGARAYRNYACHQLTQGAEQFIHRCCDPCGESVTNVESAKVPDGALPNSVSLQLRELAVIRAPFTTAKSVPLTGDMWTLTLLKTPMFRCPYVLVADLDNAEMTQQERIQLIDAWNDSEALPRYPDWQPLEENLAVDLARTFWTTIGWSALKRVALPINGTSTEIEQFRITSDGVTVFDNTPDLINQGMVVGCQYSANIAETTTELGDFGRLQGIRWVVQVQSGTTASRPNLNWRSLPAVVTTVTSTGLSVTPYNNPDPNGVRTPGVIFSSPNLGSGSLTVNINMIADIDFTIVMADGNDSPAIVAGQQLIWQLVFNQASPGAPRNLLMRLVGSGTNPEVYYTFGTISNFQFYTFVNITGQLNPSADPEVRQVTTFQLPPTSMESILQSSPKAVFMTMKEANGVYMPGRIFQPVFNVQKASNVRAIELTETGYRTAGYTGGSHSDVFDLNFSVGVIVMSSIPLACAPSLKMIRDVELVAGDDSIYQPFMSANEVKCEAALEAVQAVSTYHPFMYPETYNVFGQLSNILTNFIKDIPILGNVGGALGSLVQNLLGSSQGGGSHSQNVLASLNPIEIQKLVANLQQQLGIN